MRLEDYWSPDPAAPDKFYARKAAVIEGFEFDRVKYKIAGSTYRATDMTHWLALDTAARALEDAGFADGDGLPKATTAVIVGNTLTGEFARANLMRLRWPYVRRTLGSALKDMGWDDAELAGLLGQVEQSLQERLPADRRGHARGRPVQHHRGPDLQPVRFRRRRLHGGRRVLVIPAVGGRPRATP